MPRFFICLFALFLLMAGVDKPLLNSTVEPVYNAQENSQQISQPDPIIDHYQYAAPDAEGQDDYGVPDESQWSAHILIPTDVSNKEFTLLPIYGSNDNLLLEDRLYSDHDEKSRQ